MFAPQRKPLVDVSLGDGRYQLTPSVDAVILSAPLLMQHEVAGDVFLSAEAYDPKRFLQPRNESLRSADVMSWGAGHHLCPAKAFALCEIKMALAFIANTFERFEIQQQPPTGYHSVAAIAEHYAKCDVRLKLRGSCRS